MTGLRHISLALAALIAALLPFTAGGCASAGSGGEHAEAPAVAPRLLWLGDVKNLSGRPMRNVDDHWYTANSLPLTELLGTLKGADLLEEFRIIVGNLLEQHGHHVLYGQFGTIITLDGPPPETLNLALTAWSLDAVRDEGTVTAGAVCFLTDGKGESLASGRYQGDFPLLEPVQLPTGGVVIGAGRVIEGRVGLILTSLARRMLIDAGLISGRTN
jgi:hypothetical protein